MRIGIIGASLAGLTAGQKLAKAGHEVTVIEKSRILGGRLATFDLGNGNIFDYGESHFKAKDNEFRSFVNAMIQQGVLAEWSSRFEYYDGTQLHDINPNRSADTYYAAPDGITAIAEKLSRWVDVKSEEKAGGLTYIGAARTRKRAWMINLTDISVFECDAVIIAAPAPEAYGVLLTAQDETPARRIIRHIDEIEYDSGIALMTAYEGRESPEWKAIECSDSMLYSIINESSKRKNRDASLVLHSTDSFAREHVETDPEKTARELLEHAADISGERWLALPDWNALHYWKYSRCTNPMDEAFLELEMEEAPLALVGDYLGGSTTESAYLSGLKLADYWIRKYDLVESER